MAEDMDRGVEIAQATEGTEPSPATQRIQFRPTERIVIDLRPGETVAIDAPQSDLTYAVEDGNVLIRHANGGQVVLRYDGDGSVPAYVSIADSVQAYADLLVIALQNVETAAGPTSGGGTPGGDTQLAGALGLTSLEFGAANETTLSGALGLGEGDLSGPLPLDLVTFGAEEGESTASTTGVDTAEAPTLQVTAASGAEDAPIALAIQAALVDTDGSETLSIAITGSRGGDR
jgi:hypothetical protein